MTAMEMSRAGTPPIIVSQADYDRLCDLAIATSPQSAAGSFLLRELERAQIVEPEAVPASVVALYKRVEYRDDASGQLRQVVLVCPGEQDADAGRVSALTPLGAALLGLSTGQSISWTAPNGGERHITVLRVEEAD